MTGNGSKDAARAISDEQLGTWPYPSKQIYYVTFPWQSVHKDEYSEVVAESRRAARAKVVAVYGQSWAFLYSAAEFEGQKEQFGLTLFQRLE